MQLKGTHKALTFSPCASHIICSLVLSPSQTQVFQSFLLFPVRFLVRSLAFVQAFAFDSPPVCNSLPSSLSFRGDSYTFMDLSSRILICNSPQFPSVKAHVLLSLLTRLPSGISAEHRPRGAAFLQHLCVVLYNTGIKQIVVNEYMGEVRFGLQLTCSHWIV